MKLSTSIETALVRDDPITCVRYFEEKINKLSKLIEDKNGPFGENFVTDSYQRREFQCRGSVHTHNLLCNNNAPVYDETNIQSVDCIKFIDKFITCKYDHKTPLMAFQRHHHTRTCYKYEKTKTSY